MANDPYPRDGRPTDAEIVAASWSDPERFAKIFERHFAAIHRYLARRVGEPLAGDLAAEVFTVAFARRRTFRLEMVDTRPWLYGIATNLIRNNRRSEQRLLAAVARLRGETVTAVGGIDNNEDPSDRPELARALASLGRDQRDVLSLHAWAELSHAEIADALGIPPGTVASRLARARRRLRAALAEGRGDEDSIPAGNVSAKEEQ